MMIISANNNNDINNDKNVVKFENINESISEINNISKSEKLILENETH